MNLNIPTQGGFKKSFQNSQVKNLGSSKAEILKSLTLKDPYVYSSAGEILQTPDYSPRPYLQKKDTKAPLIKKWKRVGKHMYLKDCQKIKKKFHQKIFSFEHRKHSSNVTGLFQNKRKFSKDVKLKGLADVTMAQLVKL